MQYWVCFVLGGFTIGLAAVFGSNGYSPPELVGASYSELIEMKSECEKDLPRSKVCKAEIRFSVKED